MKILVASAFFPPVTTGSSHFTEDVARAYAESGHEVVVITTQSRVHQAVADDFPFSVVRLKAIWISLGLLSFNYHIPFTLRFGALRRIFKIIRDFRPDVVHINSQLFDLSVLVSVAASVEKIPKLLTIHTPLIHTNRVLHCLLSAVDRTVIKTMLTLGTTTVVGVDLFTVKLYIRRYGGRVKNVLFIPATFHPGIEVNTGGEDLKRELGIVGKKVILSLGHVIPIRSRLPLIAALPAILDTNPDVVVLVVGEVFDDRFLDLADELGVRDRVISVGRVERDRVAHYLAIADLEAHDLDGHGLGITTLEAMSSGVPIFATVNDEVFPGLNLLENELLPVFRRENSLDIAREIERLLNLDIAERENIINAQRAFVLENFTSAAVARKYLDTLRSLI